MPRPPKRLAWIAVAAVALIAAYLGLSLRARADGPTPVIFVHGNGDSAALWMATIWRFETNGYDRGRLFAIDFPHPEARSDSQTPEPNRSSPTDEAAALSAMATRVLLDCGAPKVDMVASSRGGYAVRNYVRNAGGKVTVSRAVLCGTPNHGVVRLPLHLGSEFNGLGPFLRGLNSGSEVDAGVSFLTTRSDKLDKYAQPEGSAIGMKNVPTLVGHDGPALAGARNVELAGLDHRELAFHPRAFREIYRFVTGREPRTLEIEPEEAPVLSGMVTGFENNAPTNLPLSGVALKVFAVDPATGLRRGGPVYETVSSGSGWGPFTADPKAWYEFELRANGTTVHYYREPFPRSSRYVHLRFGFPLPPGVAADGATVFLYRPCGYFGKGRDTVLLDGREPAIRPGVPSDDTARMAAPGAARSVEVRFNSEKFAVRTFPGQGNQIVVAQLSY